MTLFVSFSIVHRIVCVCVCVCVCVRARAHACVHTFVCAPRVRVCRGHRDKDSRNIIMNVCMYVCMQIHVHIYIQMRIFMYIYI